MKIISYNVNGIRAAIKKGFLNWLVSEDPDIICLQEIKALKEQLDLSLFEQAGYPYHYWFSAQKKGYSGVAILSKIKPIHVEYGTGIESMDYEGRNIRLDFKEFSVMSLYLPSGTNLNRLQHKLEYMDMFQDYINSLRSSILYTLSEYILNYFIKLFFILIKFFGLPKESLSLNFVIFTSRNERFLELRKTHQEIVN